MKLVPSKKAIEKAVLHAKGDWIITTDADCMVPPNLFLLYHQFIEKNKPVFIAAPVMFIEESGVLNTFQVLDFLALQGITAAAVGAGKHSMSNGANLAFEKSAFIAVGGYQGVDEIASGDDMFLMHKMKNLIQSDWLFISSRCDCINQGDGAVEGFTHATHSLVK